METFEQLLEIDDDDSREFSKGLAQQYVEQAVATFAEMEDALSKQDLDKLSKLGHFLKGSSASIGLIAVSKSCAEMQNFGNCLDEAGSSRISSEKALENCTGLIVKLKKEQDAAKTWLEDFYKEKW
ncbi:Phosphorelay intermediate protein [Cystobasidiomycetes sp. EMM_F5]